MDMLDLKTVDKTWSLFLDRDGVINHEKFQDYIYNYNEFVFYEGALEALKIFNEIFATIIIVTNQRGVAKELMTEEDLKDIHQKMKKDIEAAEGRIDAVYYSTSIDNSHPYRKPQTGMASKAKQDFPAIDFTKSIMVGNTVSDMEFGKNAGTYTVFIKTTSPELPLPHPLIDSAFNSLLNFAQALKRT